MAKPKSNSPKTFSFRFVKTHDFRTVAVHGAFGGVTIRGEINAVFFYDTNPIPDKIVHAVNEQGRIGSTITNSPIRPGEAVREIPFAVNMDLKTAKSFNNWLKDKIDQLEKIQEQSKIANVSNNSTTE